MRARKVHWGTAKGCRGVPRRGGSSSWVSTGSVRDEKSFDGSPKLTREETPRHQEPAGAPSKPIESGRPPKTPVTAVCADWVGKPAVSQTTSLTTARETVVVPE